MPAVLLDDDLGAGVEMAGPRIVAEPCPGLHDRVRERLGQDLHGGEPLDESEVERLHRRHRRLLQHDLREPDPVGIDRIARLRPPRQNAPMAVVPGEEIARMRFGDTVGGR